MKKLIRIMRRPEKQDNGGRSGEYCVREKCPNPLVSFMNFYIVHYMSVSQSYYSQCYISPVKNVKQVLGYKITNGLLYLK